MVVDRLGGFFDNKDSKGRGEKGARPKELGYLSVWLGGEGSTTQAHYDVANNCFVQLHGRKRFRLWPPSSHLALRVFPDAHPRARKSRLPHACFSFEHLDLFASGGGGGAHGADAPRENVAVNQLLPPSWLDCREQSDVDVAPPPAMDLVLQPGDVIFVPAFWFHHVEALASTSLHPQCGGGENEVLEEWEEKGEDCGHHDEKCGTIIRDDRRRRRGRRKKAGVCEPGKWGGVSVSLNVFSHSRITLAAGRFLGRPLPSLLLASPSSETVKAPSASVAAPRKVHGTTSTGAGTGGNPNHPCEHYVPPSPESHRFAAFSQLAAELVDELCLTSDFPARLFYSRYALLEEQSSFLGGIEEDGDYRQQQVLYQPPHKKTASSEVGRGDLGDGITHSERNEILDPPAKSTVSVAVTGRVVRAWARECAVELDGPWSKLRRELQWDAAAVVHRRDGDQGGGALDAATDVGTGGDAAALGILEITTGHLLELIGLRTFGRSNIAEALRHAAVGSHCGHRRASGQGDG